MEPIDLRYYQLICPNLSNLSLWVRTNPSTLLSTIKPEKITQFSQGFELILLLTLVDKLIQLLPSLDGIYPYP